MAGIGAPIQSMEYDADVDATLDALADHLEQHMDLDRLLSLAADVPF
jgi:adenosylcobyric acid synthase